MDPKNLCSQQAPWWGSCRWFTSLTQNGGHALKHRSRSHSLLLGKARNRQKERKGSRTRLWVRTVLDTDHLCTRQAGSRLRLGRKTCLKKKKNSNSELQCLAESLNSSSSDEFQLCNSFLGKRLLGDAQPPLGG